MLTSKPNTKKIIKTLKGKFIKIDGNEYFLNYEKIKK